MSPTANAVFDFLRRASGFILERREISNHHFREFLRNVRLLVSGVEEPGEFERQETLQELRTLRLKWLTAPVKFDEGGRKALESFCEVEKVRKRWGEDLASIYEDAWLHASYLEEGEEENPARTVVRDVIRGSRAQGRSIKVYCHKREEEHYRSTLRECGDVELEEGEFLHSVKDYRDSEIFDVLLKMGSLRSAGWGSAPDALVTSPRFGTLIQVVWEGCKDDPEFGFDPASEQIEGVIEASSGTRSVRLGGLSWERKSVRAVSTGPAVPAGSEDEPFDELGLLAGPERPGIDPVCRAVFVQVAENEGVLYAPHADVLSYDPDAQASDRVTGRSPSETLREGMFLITADVHVGEHEGRPFAAGHFANTWKAVLRQRYSDDSRRLSSKLVGAGMARRNMRACIDRWCGEGTVITAPQRFQDFERLLRVLGFLDDEFAADGLDGRSWLRRAWNEVSRSKGEAIKSGQAEQTTVVEELTTWVEELPDLALTLASVIDAAFPIPEESGLKGSYRFRRILAIEEGYMAPVSELRKEVGMEAVNRWRG